MKMAIMTTRYDYFDYNGRYSKPQTTVIEGALNAWNFYKSEHSKDYHYDDSYRETHIYRLPRDYGYEKPSHKVHGQRFGHKPTVEEKLNRAIEDAMDAWIVANKEYYETREKYGYWHPKTNDARIKAESLWEKIEEAEVVRDEYLEATKSTPIIDCLTFPWDEEQDLFVDEDLPF